MLAALMVIVVLLFVVILLLLADTALGFILWHVTGRVGPWTTAMGGFRHRRWGLRLTRSIVGQLTTVTRLNLPLAPALLTASRSERGWEGRALAALGRLREAAAHRRRAALLGQGAS